MQTSKQAKLLDENGIENQNEAPNGQKIPRIPPSQLSTSIVSLFSKVKLPHNETYKILVNPDSIEEFKRLFKLSHRHHWKIQQKVVFRCYRLTDDDMKVVLSEITKNLSQIQHLDFELNECKITDTSVGLIISTITRNLTQLKQLDLNFSYSRLITDEGAKAIASQLPKNCPQLQHLSLSFYFCRVLTDEPLGKLMSGITRYLTNLRSFDLDLSYCKAMTDKTLEPFGSKRARHFTQVENLKFTSRCCDISDDSVQALATHISNLRSLKTLSLDFRTCDSVTIDGMRALGSAMLKHIESLQQIEILWEQSSSRSELINSETILFAPELSKPFTQLNKVDLNFAGRGLADQTIIAFGLEISKCFANTKQLSLNFNDYGDIGDKGLEALASAIGTHLNQLKKLDLKFRGCSKITDNGITRFSSLIVKNLSRLQELALDFERCTLIKNKGAKALATEISKSLKQLQFLGLNFPSSVTGHITKALEKLLNYIPNAHY